ncbi:MAG TPA: hypothetical protein VGL26_06330 [Jatrophihabitans sp.]|jgi:hypothetical protein
MTPRARGAITGLGLVLLGAWAAVVPFIGPYFDYGYTPDTTWTWTEGRGLLEVLPGAVAFAAGLALLLTRHRAVGVFASWLATVAGAWLVLGPLVAPLWRADLLGTPIGDSTDVSMAQLGMFYGVGAVIMLFAGTALGRFSVIGVRDVEYVEAAQAEIADDMTEVPVAPVRSVPPEIAEDYPAENYAAEDYPQGVDHPTTVTPTPEPVAEEGPRHSFRHKDQRTPATH